MPAIYTAITYGEMREVLKVERGWVELKNHAESTKEYVFTRDLETLPGVQIKVYSSIPRYSERARGCGQDAIRVCAIRLVDGKWQGLVKSQRVHRTQNRRDAHAAI